MKEKILSVTLPVAVSWACKVFAQAPVTAVIVDTSAMVADPVWCSRTNGNIGFGNTAPSGTAGVVAPTPGATRRTSAFWERSIIDAAMADVTGESG